MKRAVLVLIAAGWIAAPASAALTTTVAETFDGPLDRATWRLGTVRGERVCADDEVLSAGRGQRGQHLVEVAVHSTARP